MGLMFLGELTGRRDKQMQVFEMPGLLPTGLTAGQGNDDI